jgi:4,4'-diaponeurosporenoate glycosyltransferase
MILPALLCALGLPTGFLLIWRIPLCPPVLPHAAASFSVIIPARNEAQNLPRLLASISKSAMRPAEVIVVDDDSTDNTAAVATTFGVRVIASARRPSKWIGKPWACYQGAQHAIGELLVFLDADTYFVPGGLDRAVARWLREQDRRVVVSLLPFHVMSYGYEQLSLFFNVLMAAGAGGFGAFSSPRLFGQSLLISRETYFRAGGHAAVPGVVLENLRWATSLRTSGASFLCLGGKGALHMRMFPDGFHQMSESWGKAFTQGATDSGVTVLALAVAWISALWSTAFLLVVPHDYGRFGLAIVYLLFVLQLAWLARQLGSYHFLICVLYPFPLAYFCIVFGQATWRGALGRKAGWRGREV